MDDLLSRLIEDGKDSPSSLAIVQLLKGTLYPQRSDGISAGPEQLSRALSLIQDHPLAASVFYSMLYRVSSVGSAVKISVLLISRLLDAFRPQEEVILTILCQCTVD